MITKTTGLAILGVGAGINAIDYFTASTATTVAGSPTATSQGGIFYGPGGVLANFPRAGLILMAVGLGIWLLR